MHLINCSKIGASSLFFEEKKKKTVAGQIHIISEVLLIFLYLPMVITI